MKEQINRAYEYFKILLETVGWKKPTERELPLYFLNDVDKIAQQYGYKAVGYGEDGNKRAILFIKDEEVKEIKE